ncbi:O-antigen ligase family protein [Flavobacterium gawalongense]|uniref:O-antigen ligase family protein n=1 Tax=Flavobacterium gawalongense TaxID=2594432 RepID=A0A553BWS8_9FLAO|nr:O-antigen ligase family protein [Flavobacterium gawalongense]TRX09713.1 O-antigen ligase family protein [Flavobacterium gawalongense]TRX12596.1 O-antigen ligase family protein [Flavobacterium gawalongense]TRX26836.1 O-antigen ligase family protein [Flavobacterium gawalongense]
MNISEKNFNKIFNGFLFFIAIAMIFRKPCTWLIILFAVSNLFFLKKLKFTQTSLLLGAVIASPLLLEILLFWNNNSYLMGIKSIEKSISLLIFPLFILGNFQRIKFFKLTQLYSFFTTSIILFFFIRFTVIAPDLMNKYLNGIDLWEMGYEFSNSIGIHAPALNMHLSFVAIINLYFVFNAFRERKGFLIKIVNFTIFGLSFFFVLFVNTRMALFNMLIGFVLVFFYQVIRKYNFKKGIGIAAVGLVLLGSIFLLFVQKNPYMKEKYTAATFAYMDKIGKLDAIENPEIKVFNSFVTRVSIWKSAWELSLKNLPFGVGASDGKPELDNYYKQTNQHFLAKYEFPTHNQFLDFLLKYGILGPIVVFLYIFTIGYLGFRVKNAIIIAFFFIFFTSNLTDDFLLRFDGIVFSGLWFSIFGSYWLQEKITAGKEELVF